MKLILGLRNLISNVSKWTRPETGIDNGIEFDYNGKGWCQVLPEKRKRVISQKNK